MAQKVVWIDTNVIIYYLRHNSEFSPTARKLIDQAKLGEFTLKVTPIVISECVFVLGGKQFNRNKQEIATVLTSFINIKGVDAEEKEVIERSLTQYTKKGIDFVDAYIAEHAKAATPAHVISINVRDFRQLDVLIQTPNQVIE